MEECESNPDFNIMRLAPNTLNGFVVWKADGL